MTILSKRSKTTTRGRQSRSHTSDKNSQKQQLQQRRDPTVVMLLSLGSIVALFFMLDKDNVAVFNTSLRNLSLSKVVVINDANNSNANIRNTIPPTSIDTQNINNEDNDDTCSSQALFEHPENFVSCIRKEPTPSCGQNTNLEQWESIMQQRFGKYNGQCGSVENVLTDGL